MKLFAVYEPAPEGGFTCFVEEFPEVFSEGETLEEAKANLQDALREVVAWHRDAARGRLNGPSVIREEMELAAV